MSGPKVVRIVTRDEVIAIGKGQLVRLNEAVQAWIRLCQRNEAATEDEIAATVARQTALRQLLNEDRFDQLQLAVGAEIDFLKQDQELRLERAALQKANSLTKLRRTEAAAAAVLAALDRNHRFVPDDLRSSLEQIAAGRLDNTAPIDHAFSLLQDDVKTPTVSERQRELAAAHKNTDCRATLDDWPAAQSHTEPDEEYARLNLRLAQLEVLLGETKIVGFRQRLQSLSSEIRSQSRLLLLDSLELDLAKAVKTAKQKKEAQLRLRMLAAELSEIDVEEAAEFSRLILTQLDRSLEDLLKLDKQGREFLEQAIQQHAARSRRQAVLKGLADVGYQVSEGMETAWVEAGRIVLRREMQSGYGVEISGRIDSGQVQMRTVAFRSPDDPGNRKTDGIAETAFCNDVSKLQTEFAANGNEIVIERSSPIGATPLKTVAEIREEEFQRLAPPVAKQRSIK